MAEAVKPVKAKGVRGSDRAKILAETGWTDAKVVGEFEEGHKLLYLPHPYDLALLGKTMGHCSGTHFVWASELKIWYFFAIVDAKGVPLGTLHCKDVKWIGKAHPLDAEVRKQASVGMPPRFFFGNYPEKVYKTKAYLRRNEGYYVTFATVEAAFKEAGLEYEPGKYAPPNGLSSHAYDNPRGYKERDLLGWDGVYFQPIPRRPAEVSEALFAEYQRCWKAMKDEYDKNIGNFAVVGRRFKFDAKTLIILSFSNKSQYNMAGRYRFWLRDWINAHQKIIKGELA